MAATRFGQYPPRMMEHFSAPRNAGTLPCPPALKGRAEYADCGDALELFVRLADGRVEEARYLVRGCPASIAAGSALTELLRGMPMEKASALESAVLDEALGGLPETKHHALDLALRALQAALASRS